MRRARLIQKPATEPQREQRHDQPVRPVAIAAGESPQQTDAPCERPSPKALSLVEQAFLEHRNAPCIAIVPHLAQHFDKLLERLRPEFLAQMRGPLPHQPIRPRLPVRFCHTGKAVIGEAIEVNVTGQFVAGHRNLGHRPRLAIVHELKGMSALEINRSFDGHLLMFGRGGRTEP